MSVGCDVVMWRRPAMATLLLACGTLVYYHCGVRNRNIVALISDVLYVITWSLAVAKEALESATKAETWATKRILKLSRDSKRVCRLITGPRRTIFADDAGNQLCHVEFLPAKRNTVVNF